MNALINSTNPLDEELNREKYLGSYCTFEGSPLSKGLFQFDLWNSGDKVDTKEFGIGRCLDIILILE